MIDLSLINWIKTREPLSLVTLNRPTKDLIELLNDNYELPVAISDEKGDGEKVVINQKLVTEFLTGWGSDEPLTLPDGLDTIISGVYKAEGLFVEDILGPGSKLLVIGNKSKTTQIVFSSGWTHIRESTGYLPSGQILWGDWRTVISKDGVRSKLTASDISSGVFDINRIPELPPEKITRIEEIISTSHKLSNGWLKVGDIIIQWGITPLFRYSVRTITYPISFTSSVYNVTVQPIFDGTDSGPDDNNPAFGVPSANSTSFRLSNRMTYGERGGLRYDVAFYWMAIGY